MNKHISHDSNDESPQAKASWFQSLTVAQRMDYLCEITDLALENNPKIAELKMDKWSSMRVQILTLPNVENEKVE